MTGQPLIQPKIKTYKNDVKRTAQNMWEILCLSLYAPEGKRPLLLFT
jgi:hypothetical protein